jgi:hypothetical protein
MSDNTIRYCGCKTNSSGVGPFHISTQGAEYQDKRYGPGMRVFTARKDQATNKYVPGKCTVCGKAYSTTK